MSEIRDWQSMQRMSAHLLQERTGADVETWNKRIEQMPFENEQQLRDWLTSEGVTGYAQSLLVMEHFGYPRYLLATADELIEGQYADRLPLRPILDGILHAAMELGQVTIQARKSYVSLLSPLRTFARVQPTTRQRIDLGLRLEGIQPDGRLAPSKIHESMPFQMSVTTLDEVDDELRSWLERAYQQNL